jgi:hypothetical protein
MASNPRKMPESAAVDSLARFIELLVLRCEDRGIATSSAAKLPGVRTHWLHEMKVGRQQDVYMSKIFPLVEALGLELTLTVKQSSKTRGHTAARRLRRQTDQILSQLEQFADPPILSDEERAEIEQAMNGIADPAAVSSSDEAVTELLNKVKGG